MCLGVTIAPARCDPAETTIGVAHGNDPLHYCPTVSVVGPLNETTAHNFCEQLMDVVFSLPACGLVLDLQQVTELDPSGLGAIRNVRLALEDQGAELHVLGLEDSGEVTDPTTELRVHAASP
jgi:anti-anti-sigma regulatory factor